jgi:hypothetical protein
MTNTDTKTWHQDYFTKRASDPQTGYTIVFFICSIMSNRLLLSKSRLDMLCLAYSLSSTIYGSGVLHRAQSSFVSRMHAVCPQDTENFDNMPSDHEAHGRISMASTSIKASNHTQSELAGHGYHSTTYHADDTIVPHCPRDVDYFFDV